VEIAYHQTKTRKKKKTNPKGKELDKTEPTILQTGRGDYRNRGGIGEREKEGREGEKENAPKLDTFSTWLIRGEE